MSQSKSVCDEVRNYLTCRHLSDHVLTNVQNQLTVKLQLYSKIFTFYQFMYIKM